MTIRIGRVSLVCAIGTAAALAAPSARGQTVVDYFSWGDVVSHPEAIPGGDLEGLPDGNYLTPSEDQRQRCAGGCVLYATVGAMEMQYKIQLREPQVTLDLSEDYFLDQFNTQNYGMGTGTMCNSDCTLDNGVSVMSCVPAEIGNVGLIREQAVGDPSYSHITYSLLPQRQGFEFFTSNTSFDSIKARLLRGPVVGTIQVDATQDGSQYLWCNSSGPSGAVDQLYHRVVFVGYRSTEYPSPTGGTEVHHALQIKNSWGKNPQHYSSYDWMSWDSECLYKEDWLQILRVEVSDDTQDLDGDTIEDHRDICLGIPSGRLGVQQNLDNDALGDECDPDIDDDRVLDDLDCHPHNRFLSYDLDQDGLCDDEELVVTSGGMPVDAAPALGANWLLSPALVDYKRYQLDGRTDDSVNHWRAVADGDTAPGTDLSVEQICLAECDRIATMDLALRPSQFTLNSCRARCQPALTPRDRCSPYSIPADGGNPALWDACDTVRFCATLDAERRSYCGATQMAIATNRCSLHWYNPGAGQIDSDSDGYADYCDSERMVGNFEVEFETENYQMAGDTGIELLGIHCYTGEAKVRFDAYGHMEQDGSRLAMIDNDVQVAACYCPSATWDASCETYCPADGEYPNSGDALWNPGVDNHAWDPISSPNDCFSKLDQVAGLDHHLCDSTSVFFGGPRYDPEPAELFVWRWGPFYDADRSVGDDLVAHPGIGYSTANPGLVKIRVAWPSGAAPSAAEKSISPQAVQMRGGCANLDPSIFSGLQLRPEWLVTPHLFRELTPPLPGDWVSGGFEDLTRAGAALAFSNDHVMAIDPADGGLLAALPVTYLGSARLAGDGAGRGTTTLAAMDSTAIPGVTGEDGALTPVLLHHDGAQLWLGLIGFDNAWQTWEEAFGAEPPAFDHLAAALSTPDGRAHLFGLEPDGAGGQQWALYSLRATTWEQAAVLPSSWMAADVRGFAASLSESGRALFLFGGQGSGWSKPVHRLDLLTGALREVVAEGFANWDPTDRAPGLSRRGDLVHLVGSSAVVFNTSTFESHELAVELPDDLGDAPFVHFDGASGQLTAMAVGGAGDPLVIKIAPSADGSWRATPTPTVIPAPDAAEPRAGGMVQGETAMHLFEVTAESVGVEHEARLIATGPELGLQLLDAEGQLVDEDLRQELVNVLAFTPAVGDAYFIFKVVPTTALDPDVELSYQLVFEPTGVTPPVDGGACPEADGGACSCGDAGACACGDAAACACDDGDDDDGDDEGCGCGAAAPGAARVIWLALLGLFMLGLARSRSRR